MLVLRCLGLYTFISPFSCTLSLALSFLLHSFSCTLLSLALFLISLAQSSLSCFLLSSSLVSLALFAKEHDYIRPELTDDNAIYIKAGRSMLHCTQFFLLIVSLS